MAIKLGKNGLPIGQGFYWKRETIYVTIWHDGKKHGPYCTRTGDWKAALKFRADKLAAITKGEELTIPRWTRIADLFDDYIAHLESKEQDSGAYMERKYETSSYKCRTRINKHLVPVFGKLKPEELTSDLLRSYKDRRNREGASVATINSEFRILRAALRRGTKVSPRKVNPLHIPSFDGFINDRAEKKLARTGVIAIQQYRLILEALADHLKPVFVTVYWTGIRGKEIKFVRRTNVNFEENTIILAASETKAGDLRVAPMNDEVKATLMKWEEQTTANFPKTKWFFHFNGEQLGNWKTAWNAALKRCGLRIPVLNADGSQKTRIAKTGKRRKVWQNLVKFHDTRRTMITNLDEAGIEERDTMKVSGHSTTDMSRRYNQSKEAAERVRQAQNKMLGLGATEPSPNAPATSNDDWKAQLKELKMALDEGLLPADVYAAEVAKVMARRSS